MPRPRRATVSGIACHVLNRRVMRLPIFEKPGDYEAFERVLAEGLRRPDALGVLTRGNNSRLTIFRVVA